MNSSIQNSIALVTGAKRGIGKAIVESLLSHGAAKVYAGARNPDSLANLVAGSDGKVVPLKLDVTDQAQVDAAAAAAPDATIVINNAGVIANPDLFGGDFAAAEQEFTVNYFGVLSMSRAFDPILKARGSGTLVNLSSIAGLSNFPMLVTYSDSKAAVHSLTQGTRHLLTGSGVNVLGVYPGPVDTDMAKDIEFAKETPDNVADTIIAAIESGAEEVFTDEMARGYAPAYEAGHKALELGTREMMAQAAGA